MWICEKAVSLKKDDLSLRLCFEELVTKINKKGQYTKKSQIHNYSRNDHALPVQQSYALNGHTLTTADVSLLQNRKLENVACLITFREFSASEGDLLSKVDVFGLKSQLRH